MVTEIFMFKNYIGNKSDPSDVITSCDVMASIPWPGSSLANLPGYCSEEVKVKR